VKTLLFIILISNILFASEKNTNIGEEIYNTTCISCHGIDGKSNTGMKLSVKPRILANSILSQKQIKMIVAKGAHEFGAYSDIMPNFSYIYKDAQIESVSKYVYNKFVAPRETKIKAMYDNSDIKNVTLKRGKKIFKRNCALCHGITGNGKSEYVEMSIQNKQFIYPYDLRKILLNKKQIFLFAKYGGLEWGTHENIMPSWKKKYNDSDLMSVAKYIDEVIKDKK